jgi:hypothetical protein
MSLGTGSIALETKANFKASVRKFFGLAPLWGSDVSPGLAEHRGAFRSTVNNDAAPIGQSDVSRREDDSKPLGQGLDHELFRLLLLAAVSGWKSSRLH